MLVLLTKENIMSGINNKLKKLYNKKWEQLIENGKDLSAASPLLIKIDEKAYKKADIKVIIFGQETYKWNGEIGSKCIDFLMNDYKAVLHNDQKYFDKNSNYANDDYSRAVGKHKKKGRIKRKNDRSFWNKNNFKFFKEKIKLEGKNIEFLWNNLAKIGKANSKGKQTEAIKELEKNYFQVFEQELKILKPDVIIFRTGHRYIPNSESKKITKNNPVSVVKLTNFPDIFAVKTYHPSKCPKEFKYQVLELIEDYLKSK